jgi:hypothetical protein
MPVTEAQSGATFRRLPITQQLRNILRYAARQAGVKVKVTSGGQKHVPGAAGRSIKGVRTGSTRHDIRAGSMGAADVTLELDGRTLSMTNAADASKMAIFVEAAVAAGAVGVGAGVGYMGANTIHVGGGTAAVWGAGKGKPIASFIRGAHQRGMQRFRAGHEVRAAQA